jgi:hypothetical protein
MQEQQTEVNVLGLMAEIRLRVRQQNRSQDELARRARARIPASLRTSIAAFRAQAAGLRASVEKVGEFPPVPPTIRGRLGFVLVWLVRRALFWLIPPLKAAHMQTATALEEQAAIAEQLATVLEETNLQIESLRRLLETERQQA